MHWRSASITSFIASSPCSTVIIENPRSANAWALPTSAHGPQFSPTAGNPRARRYPTRPSSQEFAAVRLADRHSRASALMPQKRNPYALAVVRTQAGIAAGELTAMLVAVHTGSARTDHFHLLNGSVPRLLG